MQVAAVMSDGEQPPHFTRSPSGRSPQCRPPPCRSPQYRPPRGLKLNRERVRISQPATVVVEGDKKMVSVSARQVMILSGELTRLRIV